MADDEVTDEDTRGKCVVDASKDPRTDLHLSSEHIHRHHTVNTTRVTVNTGTILSTKSGHRTVFCTCTLFHDDLFLLLAVTTLHAADNTLDSLQFHQLAMKTTTSVQKVNN